MISRREFMKIESANESQSPRWVMSDSSLTKTLTNLASMATSTLESSADLVVRTVSAVLHNDLVLFFMAGMAFIWLIHH
jgi:hypothetical protein